MYAHVENGSVTYRGFLPKSWRNTSGLNLSAGDDDYLKTLGWLPYVEVPVEIGVDETSDGEDTVITETEVTSTAKKRAMTADEKTDRTNSAFAELRRERDELLHDTDWWVLRGSITELQTAYRQALRELPATVADPANPTWPVAPEA
jgi:hypothetical protein